jgi:trehalose 6-phosphate synthase
MARQIATALKMSVEERRERWERMVTKLKRAPVQNWFTDFLQTLAAVRRAPALPPHLLMQDRVQKVALQG